MYYTQKDTIGSLIEVVLVVDAILNATETKTRERSFPSGAGERKLTQQQRFFADT